MTYESMKLFFHKHLAFCTGPLLELPFCIMTFRSLERRDGERSTKSQCDVFALHLIPYPSSAVLSVPSIRAHGCFGRLHARSLSTSLSCHPRAPQSLLLCSCPPSVRHPLRSTSTKFYSDVYRSSKHAQVILYQLPEMQRAFEGERFIR